MATKAKVTIYLLLLSFSSLALAFQLKTQDFQVQFPTNWGCNQEENIFVCTENSKKTKKPGVIVFQFGEAGPLDTISQFKTRLQSPRSIKGKGGLPTLSRVISLENKNINGHEWFESLHYESELSEFYTYYVATRRGDLQFLMTLTAHKNEWSRYKPLFESTIKSIRLMNSTKRRQIVPQTNNQNVGSAQATATPNIGAQQPGIMQQLPSAVSKVNKGTWILIASVIAALLMLIYAIKV